VTYDDPKKAEGVREWERGSRREWDAFGRYLEAEYKTSIGKGPNR